MFFYRHLCVEMMFFNVVNCDMLSNFCLDGGIVYSVDNIQARAIKDL